MIFAWFTALPRSAKLALAVIAGLLLAWALWSLWLRGHDRAVIERHEEVIEAEVERKAGEASEAAADAAAATKSDVEKTNDEARKAADGSDDPLRAALDSLH